MHGHGHTRTRCMHSRLIAHWACVRACAQDLSEWACIYIKYLQILRKLEAAYDQMVHPQKRLDMRKALEACIGRLLEIRHWMVSAPNCHAGPLEGLAAALL